MNQDFNVSPPRSWPFVVAALAALLWLVVAGLAFAPLLPGVAIPAAMRGIGMAATVALTMLAPLAVLWLVASRLRDRSRDRAARTALMAEHSRFTEQRIDQGANALVMLEDRMSALTARLEAVSGPVERQHQMLLASVSQLEAASSRLNEVSARAEAATATLGSAAPDAMAQAERLTEMLARADTELRRQLTETEAMLQALQARAGEAEAQARATTAETVSGMAAIAAQTTASLSAITDAGREASAGLTTPLAQLVDGVETAFARTAAAMDATRDGVHTQTNAMLASVDQARVTLDHIGGEAARQIKTRLETLLGTAGQIGAELEAQAERSNALIEDVSRGFAILDAKLDNSITTGNTAMESISARMNEARDAIHRLGDPIAATETALATIEARLLQVGTATGETLGSLGTALPAAVPHIEDMALRLSELHDRADQLILPLTAGGDSIAAAQAQLDRAREALDAAATQLVVELNTARSTLADIEASTGNASLAASTQLIEVFGRVREIANQTAGTMRETLSNVVAEAEAALDQAGSSRAELAFGVPIRAQIAEVESLQTRVAAAGQAASERITQRLLALAETVAGVEQRIDEVDTRFDVRARNTLAKRSGALLDSMQAAAIDIAGLLSFQIEDTAWDNYLKGDKSIFARRIVEQMDGNATRAIARHFQHDPEFRNQATHYIEEFETLISHVLPDREGKTLAVTLLSSNVGRLYVALGQAVDRFQ